MKLTADSAKAIAILGAAAVVGFVLYKAYSAGAKVLSAGADVLTHELNPASDQNLAYRAVNSVVPGENATLGTWLYDLFNPPKSPEYNGATYGSGDTAEIFRAQDKAF